MERKEQKSKVSPSHAKKNGLKMAEHLSKTTHFTRHEVESLLRLYYELNNCNHEARLDRAKFRDILHNILHVTEDMLMDRVFKSFDRDNDGIVDKCEWVRGLSVVLRGTMEERTKYCFEVYDLNADGYVSREEMLAILKNSLAKQPSEEDPDEGVKDLVELTLKKMDYDHDTRLSYEDYKQAVKEEPLLLEAFGCCLPDDRAIRKFQRRLVERAKNDNFHVSDDSD